MGLFAPLRSWKGGPLALFTAIVLTSAIVMISYETVDGLLGWLLAKMDITNDARTFRLALGTIIGTALKAGIAVFAMLFLLKGGNPTGDLKDVANEAKGDS